MHVKIFLVFRYQILTWLALCKQKDDRTSELIWNAQWRRLYSVQKIENIDINREADVQTKKTKKLQTITVQNVHVHSN